MVVVMMVVVVVLLLLLTGLRSGPHVAFRHKTLEREAYQAIPSALYKVVVVGGLHAGRRAAGCTTAPSWQATPGRLFSPGLPVVVVAVGCCLLAGFPVGCVALTGAAA